MRQTVAFVLFSGLVAGLGCQGNASFKSKTADGGMVELNAKGDVKDVISLLDKEAGKDNYIYTDVTSQVNVGPQQQNDGKKYFAYQKKMNTTPAGLPPAPNGGIQQTGGSLPIPNLPQNSGQYRPGQASLGQPSMPTTGRSNFAGER